MKAVKQEASQLEEVEGADAAQRATTAGAGIGTALKAEDHWRHTYSIYSGALG